jgi:hypothetical protein
MRANTPSELLKFLLKGNDTRLTFRIICGSVH